MSFFSSFSFVCISPLDRQTNGLLFRLVLHNLEDSLWNASNSELRRSETYLLNKYFTFRDRSVIVRVNEHDGQAFLRKIEFALKYRGQLFGVLLLSDSPVQYRVQLCLKLVNCQLYSTHLSSLSLTCIGLKLQKFTRMTTLLQKFPNILVMTLNKENILYFERLDWEADLSVLAKGLVNLSLYL